MIRVLVLGESFNVEAGVVGEFDIDDELDDMLGCRYKRKNWT